MAGLGWCSEQPGVCWPACDGALSSQEYGGQLVMVL